MSEKTCTKCGETLPATTEYFYKSKYSDGLTSQCKKCKCTVVKGYYQKNKEKNKEYYEKNKEHLKEKNKEHKKAIYKEWIAQLPAGTYRIINTENGRPYIGQSSGYSRRWSTHKSALRRNKHDNKQLQEDYNTYGEEAFIFEVIEELPCDTPEEVLREKEQEEIKKHLREGKDTYNRFS